MATRTKVLDQPLVVPLNWDILNQELSFHYIFLTTNDLIFLVGDANRNDGKFKMQFLDRFNSC
jgi:hypothetical protein